MAQPSAGSPNAKLTKRDALGRNSRDEFEASLEQQLTEERARSKKLMEEMNKLKANHVTTHAKAQQEEEAVTNKLLKKLTAVRQEKERVLAEVKKEEEFLTNTLRTKLTNLRREKQKLETMISNENKKNQELQGEVFKVSQKKHELEADLSTHSTQMLGTLHRFINDLDLDDSKDNNSPESPSPTDVAAGKTLIHRLKDEIKDLRQQHEKFALTQKEQATRHHQMAERIKQLDTENFTLQQKKKLSGKELKKLRAEKAQMESAWEQDDELAFNRERRDRGFSVSSSCSEASTDLSAPWQSIPNSPKAREQAAFRALALENKGNMPPSPAMHALTSPGGRRTRSYSAASNPDSAVSSHSGYQSGGDLDVAVPPPHLSVAPGHPPKMDPSRRESRSPRRRAQPDLPKLKPRQSQTSSAVPREPPAAGSPASGLILPPRSDAANAPGPGSPSDSTCN